VAESTPTEKKSPRDTALVTSMTRINFELLEHILARGGRLESGDIGVKTFVGRFGTTSAII
jgi:hypothetical protein